MTAYDSNAYGKLKLVPISVGCCAFLCADGGGCCGGMRYAA